MRLFSQSSSDSKGCRYVQDRLWEEREEVIKVFNEAAALYVCGSSMVGEGAANIAKRIYQEAAEALGKSKTNDEVETWFAGIKSDRYASDVFV